MTQLTDSSNPIQSSCSSTYQGNDAWFNLEIPHTGNVMVRANIENTISAVIQAYTGNCNNLNLFDCQILDSLPYTLLINSLPAGEKLYLRVWDENNTITNGGGTSLLHLTAHELDAIPENWIICDQQNNLLSNPTILSRKDGNSFIAEYDVGLSPSEIANEESYFLSQGLTKNDECLCTNNPLQLWSAANPVEMEGIKRRSKARTNVDTTNYNYIFENIEFQVNSYAIGQQYETDVDMDSDGNFVMVWVDQQRKHNYARYYGNSGNPLSPEFRIGLPRIYAI